MSNNVYITRTSLFLPNHPVGNDDMETYLGLIDGKPSRVRPIILRQNGIKRRFYALDENQNITHSNAELAKNAIDGLFDSEEDKKDIQFLSCATSMPDQLMPSHASMVHGLAFKHPLEIASLAGVCMSGLMAVKTAFLSVASGNSDNAVCVASELLSPSMVSKFYNEELLSLKQVEDNPHLAFEKDFLRFMLSDGAVALQLDNKPTGNINLKIEGIHTISYADKQKACMYMWSEKNEEGNLMGWKGFSPKDIAAKSIWSIKQDVRQLNEHITHCFVDEIQEALIQWKIDEGDITYMIPHISSMYFYNKLESEFQSRNIGIPTSKWFTNLTSVGNMGSVSPFAALDELIRTKVLHSGDKVLVVVPESGRFSFGSMLLSVE